MKIPTPFLGFCFGLALAGGILFSSCSQDAIFYTIQYDKVLNKNAAVPGSPGKIVEMDGVLYVGSNRVYRYSSGSWGRLPVQPGGKRIMDLAGTDTYLYALIMQGVHLSESGVYRWQDDGASWEPVANSTGFSIQSLWGAGDVLFAGARAGDGNYVLLYVNDSAATPVLEQAPGVSGILKGAAKFGNDYYAAVLGTGLLKGTPSALGNPLQFGGDTPTNFMGLIEISGSLIAVSNSGLIWRIDGGGTVADSRNFNVSLNGALAKWKNDPSGEGDLLLLGRAVAGGNSAATYYYGYSELPITFSGTDPVLGAALQEPGLPVGPYTSVSNNDSYYNTLGTHPVISLHQAEDGVLFATTQQDGLWSCREGDDPREWNIE